MAGSQGAGVRSIRPFQSSEQYLYAMKEDMAEWLRDLYELEISAETFLEVLETGSVLCLHANNITRVAGEFRAEYPVLAERVHLPGARVSVNRMAQPGTFQARDNVSNFIQWCRREMSITDVLMFETDDLVLRKNEKNFVLCLLELARRASRFGMSAPVLIQMEEQIEEEIREEMELPPEEIPIPKPQRRPCDFKNLDQMVQHLVSRCTCPDQFSMIKVSEGKYRVGDSSTLIFVRILRNHVMVRVGGGWDTLEHYLDKHDPCRCTSLSHKQAIKLGGAQKQIAPVHELRTRLPPKTESGNNLHPTLIVRRSQSPLPPVEWRTYNPGMSSVKTQPSTSLEGSERTSGFQTPQEKSDTKRCTLTRSLDRPATPSQRKLFVEDRSSSKQITSPRSARDHVSSSTLSLASQLTESEGGSSSKSSDVSIEAQRGRQAGRPTVTNQKEQSAKSNRLSRTMPQLGTSRDTTPQTVAGAQRCSTSQERSGRSLSPTKQLHNSSRPHVKGAEQKHHSQSESVAKVSLGPMSQRPPTPMKSITSLSKQDLNRKNKFQEDTVSMRSSMQQKSDVAEPQVGNGEIHNAEAAKAQLQQMLMTKPKVGSSAIDQIEDHSLNTVQNIIKKVARPHLDIGLGTMRCDTVWEDESTEQNNTSSQDLTDKGEREGAYTPLPINQEQEQELYRSLEDEILSNIKELEGDSDENNQSENRLGDFSRDHSITNDTAVHDFNALSSASSFPSTLKSAGEGVVVPRSGVYINTKWQAEASYDNVVLELSKGPKKLNRVDVENWIAKIPPKTEVDFVKEPHAPVPNGTEEKTEPLEKERTYTRRKTSNSELKGTKLRRVPSQRIRGGVKEVSRSQQVLSDGQASSTNSAPQESDSDKSKPLQVNKPRRSLKKPERIPSIYKLKLRPKIRPRRDNRPEKQPSKIPTPKMYRQQTNPVNTKDSKKSQPGQTLGCQSRAPQENPSTRLERSLAQSSENLASDEEACMSDQSNSLHSKSAGSKSLQERSQPEGEVDDEESWV